MSQNQRAKTVIRITLLVLAALIVGVNFYSLNAAKLGGNAVPMPFGVGAAVVLSGSMEPELSAGDLLIVVERESYSENQIIVFQDGRMAVTHRIVSISEDEIITRGDANNTEDDPITIEQVKGEVVLAIPFVGYLVNVVKTPLCTFAILALAVWLLERSYRAEKQQDAEKLNAIRAEIEKLKQKQNKDS
ncbi:MAG: signal peptidase I [Clostridia bacterium]|nr:signal peptidase I [Clostridia bacterium]